MQIGISVNHSFPHCGGSEKVVQQISESLVSSFSVGCHVFSGTTKKTFTHNGVNYHPVVDRGQAFIKDTQNAGIDSMLVYSDYFKHWPIMVNNPKKLGYKLTLATVGLNASLDKPLLLKRLKDYKDHISVITHSDNYQDFQVCKAKSITPTVIPNGVDLKEFDIEFGSFRKKYDLQDKKIILCVSNFFPGKGQEYLPEICKRLKVKDYCLVMVYSTPSFQAAQILEQRFTAIATREGVIYKMCKDLPREDVVSAFVDSDAFVFPTQKEVAPLVVLESMAAKTPWVSMPVGNVRKLAGGVIIPSNGKDPLGNCVYNNDVYDMFAEYLTKIINDEDFSRSLSDQGFSLVESDYNWDRIFKSYYDILR
jgi:glycosyltransferase involved in cell wall biosynthesis